MLRRVLERRSGAYQLGDVLAHAPSRQVDAHKLDLAFLQIAAQTGQCDQALGIVGLRCIGFQCLGRKVCVDCGQARGLGVSPGRCLQSGQPHAGQPQAHRIHTNLWVNQHIGMRIENQAGPLVHTMAALFESCGPRTSNLCFGIHGIAYAKQMQLEAARIQLLNPTFDQRVPYRVIAEVLRYETHPYRSGLANLGHPQACALLPI